MNNSAAFLADKMAVVVFFFGIDCSSVAGIRMYFFFFTEKLEKAVNRGKAYSWVVFSDSVKQFFRGKESAELAELFID